MTPVIEPRGSGRGVVRHCGGVLEGAAVLQVGGDAGRTERVVADLRADAGGDRAPANHRIGVGLG